MKENKLYFVNKRKRNVDYELKENKWKLNYSDNNNKKQQ